MAFRSGVAIGWKKTQRSTRVPSLLDLAWAAGIWEGEGSICASKTGRFSFSTRVIQKDKWILLRLQELFGGSIGVHSRSSDCHHLCVSGTRARGFIYTIFTFLSPRRRAQVRTVLDTHHGHNIIEEDLPRGF